MNLASPHDPLELPEQLGPLFPSQMVIGPERILASKVVPHVRPLVLYVSGSKSPICRDGAHEKFVKTTGTGYSWQWMDRKVCLHLGRRPCLAPGEAEFLRGAFGPVD